MIIIAEICGSNTFPSKERFTSVRWCKSGANTDKRYRKPKGYQSRLDKPEEQATLGTRLRIQINKTENNNTIKRLATGVNQKQKTQKKQLKNRG